MTPLVKRIAALLYPDERWLSWVLDRLTQLWGRPERLLMSVPFTSTDYYRRIAPRLNRAFFSFPDLLSPQDLPLWKQTAIDWERQSGPSRRVNIDPGYVDGARLVLASTKDHGHRIYMGGGIFAEVTLWYCRGRWRAFDYTFPDFRSGLYDDFLDEVRRDWLFQTKEAHR